MKKYKRILIRADVSAPARKARAAGLALAKALRAEVVALHVRERFSFVDPPPFGAAAEVDKQRALADKEADRALAAFERAARAVRVRFRGERARDDRAWQAVLDAARSLNCDLIVTAADGDTGNLVAHSKVPVLVVAG